MPRVSRLNRTLPKSVALDLAALGAAIRARRVNRNETQAQLAERLGISQRTLRAVEAGSNTVSIGIVITIMWALGLKVSAISLDSAPTATAPSIGSSKAPRARPKKWKAPDDF